MENYENLIYLQENAKVTNQLHKFDCIYFDTEITMANPIPISYPKFERLSKSLIY